MTSAASLVIGNDRKKRCQWCVNDLEYMRYHDQEWGRPVMSEDRIFEKICLEGFQSGLSWLTILRKRPAFRLAFANFEPKRVAKYSARDVNRLMKNEGIVRHRGKIEATINNAHATLELQQELGSLAKFVWSFCPENSTNTKRRAPKKNTDIAVSTPESEALSKALRGRGFAFVGPTTMHALMQSVGLVNDHFERCWVRDECEKKRVIALKKMLA